MKKQLSVTVASLREAFERYPEMWVSELAIVNRLEQMAWRSQQGGRKKLPPATLDLYQLGLDFGADFALTALRFAEPKPLANQIAQYICLDVAQAGLNEHPFCRPYFPEKWHETLLDFIRRGGDLMSLDGWCRAVQGGAHGEIAGRIADRVVAAVYGRSHAPDAEEGGLEGVLDAVDDLAWLFVRADPRYTSANRIADLAAELETRWQNGTRLNFEFMGEIYDAMLALEEELTPAHTRRALGVVWAAFVLHTRGEAIRPVAPTPALADKHEA